MSANRFKGIILAIAVFMIALTMVVPVSAILQIDLTIDNTATPGVDYHKVIVDGSGNDPDGLVNVMINLPSGYLIPGVNVIGAYESSKFGGLNLIQSASSTVTNTAGAPVRIIAAVSDTDYGPMASEASITGSGTFTNAVGSTINMQWYDDPMNVQGANSEGGGVLLPGNMLENFNYAATKSDDSFSINKDIAVSDSGLYSMSLFFDYTLVNNGMLTSRGQSMQKSYAAPEFPTVAVPVGMIIGLAGVAIFAKKSEEE